MEEKSSEMEPQPKTQAEGGSKAAGHCRKLVPAEARDTKGGHMFGFGSKSIVGLDVGSSSIKAVELKRKGGQIEVAHLGLEPLLVGHRGRFDDRGLGNRIERDFEAVRR